VKRKSNFELLRILAILFVIIIHTVSPMLKIGYPEKLTWKYSAFLTSFAYTAVPIFVLLTGYFYDTKTKYTSRLKKIYIPFLFYFIFFTAFLLITRQDGTSVTSILGKQTLFLLSSSSGYFSGQMWYLYLLLAVIVFSPFLNIVINRTDQKMHRRLIIILSVFFFVLPSINAFFDYRIVYTYSSTTIRQMLPVFITYYFIGAYISKYDISIKKSKAAWAFAASTILIFAFSLYWSIYHPIAYLINKFTGEFLVTPDHLEWIHQGNGYADQFSNYSSVFILVSAVSLLMLFKSLKVRYSKAVNYIASLTLGIYLNHIFIRSVLSQYMPSVKDVYGAKYIAISSVMIVLTFCGAVLFEAVRKALSKTIAKKIKAYKTNKKMET